MQQKSLHVQQPKRRQKHRTSDQSKEFRRPWVAERCECGKSEHSEIGERSKDGHRNSAQFGIRTTQYPKTIGRTSAAEGLAGERLHGQISCVGQTGHGNNGHDYVKNRAKPRYRHKISPRITRIDANGSKGNIGKVGLPLYALRFRNAFVFQSRIVPKIYEETKFESGCVQIV
jgi:hypothetical protein